MDALFSAVHVAAGPATDPAQFWRRCVEIGVGRMPLAGFGPDRPPAPEKPTPEAAAPVPPPPPPKPALRESSCLMDSAGWIVAAAPGFVLLSNIAAEIEEVPGGFKVRLGQKNYAFAENQGLCVLSSREGATQMTMDGVPVGWDGDLLKEFRTALRSRPETTLKEWVRARLDRHPSKPIQVLLD